MLIIAIGAAFIIGGLTAASTVAELPERWLNMTETIKYEMEEAKKKRAEKEKKE